MEDFLTDYKGLSYFVKVLEQPIIGFDNKLRFEFSPATENFFSPKDDGDGMALGTFIMIDLSSNKEYEGTYQLIYENEICTFNMKGKDFTLKYEDGFDQKFGKEFNKMVYYLTKELKGFN